jgi:molybdate transport system regulatory protein
MRLEGNLWLLDGKEDYVGEKRVLLLKAIKTYGSINSAAKAIKIGYKTAWDAIDAMNNLSQRPLVERTIGGKGGGGTSLTADGEMLIKTYELLNKKHKQLLALLSENCADIER